MTIGTRLREVRLALNMSQTEFGAAGGVLKNAQSAYETDKRSPDANYLAKISKLGVDVNYVVTGSRFSECELSLLKAINLLSPEQQTAFLKLIQTLTRF